jgi:hypothetical protein
MTKKIEAFIHEEKLKDVKKALYEIGVAKRCSTKGILIHVKPMIRPNQRIGTPGCSA